MKLSIIIPVYNEKATVREIFKQVMEIDLKDIQKEIILVDDGSKDGTVEILKELAQVHQAADLKLLYHEENFGKGAAIRSGLQTATGDLVIIQDADLEYDPEDYLRLIKPILKGKAQVVYGSRFTGEHRNMFFTHWMGNRFLTLMTNILYDSTLSDMETCYKLFTRQALEGITVKANRFEFEPEITAKVLKKGIRIYEVPISYAGREVHEGKKISWKDGFSALWTLIKYRFVN